MEKNFSKCVCLRMEKTSANCSQIFGGCSAINIGVFYELVYKFLL